ncbi:hypothetical protein J7K43_07905 [Candidatus Calescamantes bacterium]|nr:hypothetical protein [Candidatus Calescamantes bacterium]
MHRIYLRKKEIISIRKYSQENLLSIVSYCLMPFPSDYSSLWFPVEFSIPTQPLLSYNIYNLSKRKIGGGKVVWTSGRNKRPETATEYNRNTFDIYIYSSRYPECLEAGL